MTPYFSVIIPSHNRANIVNRAIQAVLGQTFQNFEIIFVDDGSTDNTKSTLQEYSSNLKIKYFYQNNAGVCAARNTGAQKAAGEFLIFLDSDDTVEKSWLEDFYDLANQNKEWLFCSMKMVKLDKSEVFYSALDPYKDGQSKGNHAAGSWAIKKSVFLRVGLFDENIKFGENVELKFRLDVEKLSVGIIDNYNFTYFESLNGGSRNLKNKIDSNLYIIKKHPIYFRLNPRVLRFYLQNIAVAYAKLGIWADARVYFWKAYITDIWKFKTLARFFIALFPLFGKKIWKQQ